MTDEAGFLGRWSRRKEAARRDGRAPGEDAAEPPPPAAGPGLEAARAPAEGSADASAEGLEEAPGAPFDPASLPPIDSLGAGSDYAAFLRPQVPRALRLAALRRAWASQPAITGFKPLADYDWDVHAPGYGKLWPTDDPAKLVEGLFRHLREDPTPAPEAPAEEAPRPDTDPAGDPLGDPPGDPVADRGGGPEGASPLPTDPALPEDAPRTAAAGPATALDAAPRTAAGAEREPRAMAAAPSEAGAPTGPPPPDPPAHGPPAHGPSPARPSPARPSPAQPSPARPPRRRHGGARPA